jgi:hypothetical protein
LSAERRNSMDIIIDEKVQKYLDGKGETSVTVDWAGDLSCCIQIPLTLVYLGKPRKKLGDFSVHQVGAYSIYLHNFLPVEDKLHFILRNFIIKKSIIVDGIRLL